MSKEDFDAIDADGDGYITASELLRSLVDNLNVDNNDIAAVITMADQDGDNKVSYEEYQRFAATGG
jgi:Ca2+-binding EF-hand superfamily protein